MARLFLFAWCLAGLAWLSAPPARAGGPEETVRWIYHSRLQGGPGPSGYAYLAAPERRAQFLTRRMVAFHAANDSQRNATGVACVDFGADIPGQDFDPAEIVRTLRLDARGDDRARQVVARFFNFGRPAEITYFFIAEDGFWKIDDIAGPGWRMSQISCPPRSAPPPSASGAPPRLFCFVTASDTMRLALREDGTASFSFDSFQEAGHSCGAEGIARPVPGGWRYEEDFSGRLCVLDIRVASDGGLTLSDVDHGCKLMLCGQRATIDGRAFPLASQVDCATLPVQ